jgi:glycosyltransferase involved in cell wall biosynthesis
LGVSWHVEAIVLWDRLRTRDIRHIHVHLNGTAPSVALVSTAFANAAGATARWSWSLTVHGPAEFYDVYGERLAEKVHSARAVICISDFTRSQLMALVDERQWSKLRTIHCGVDPDVFDSTRNGDRGPLEVLTVARLTQFKGVAMLLHALHEVRRRGVDARVTIIGEGPRRAGLERLARDLGIESVTTFAGPVGQDAIRDYYLRANAFCLPSFAEGVPVVLMEAMAMRLPVIATDVMGVRELVDDGVNGVVVRPSRPDLLADALAALAADGDLARRLGAAGRETVRREFDIRRSGAQLRALFEETRSAAET